MTIDLAKNKDEFISLARRYIKREGLDAVLAWLSNSTSLLLQRQQDTP